MTLQDFKSNYEQQLIKIAQKYDLDYFILFGSHAQNKDKLSSDFDLAYKKKTISDDDQFNLLEDIQSIFKDKAFDLVRLELKTSEVLKYEILWRGYCFYSKNFEQYREERENVYFTYIDSFALLEPTKLKYLNA
ncbi:MAG: nucleotidyltransferase domain-containing protein [Nanoarchaeota archaeon]|nr:nucleotidyltransferase domain-containing protein [Nanoarchaeota archaeon]